MKEQKRATKNNKGITIISLIIAVIILLILAGVTVSILTGENGILTKVEKSVSAWEIAQEQERLNLEIYDLILEKDGQAPTVDEVLENFIKKGIATNEETEENEDGSKDIVTDNGFNAHIDENENGNVYVEVEGKGGQMPPRITNVSYKMLEDTIEIEVEAKRAKTYIFEYKKETEEEFITIYKGTNNTCTIENVEEDVIYIIKITAINEYGQVKREDKKSINTDTTEPKLTVQIKNVTSRSIRIKATAETKGIDLIEEDTFKFYISETQIFEKTPTAKNTTGEYEFDGLDTNTTYYIKVETEDKSGNIVEKEIEQTTLLIPSAETAITKSINWNEDKTAKITLKTTTVYAIQYKLEGGTWNYYNDEISVQNNQKVEIALTDGINKGESSVITIEDNEGPTIDAKITETTTKSVTVEINSSLDLGAGIKDNAKYTYSIIKTEDETEIETKITEDTQYTFNNLTANESYTVKITLEDKVGNIGTWEGKAHTSELPAPNITFSNTIWHNGLAEITITNTDTDTSYKMQYEVIEDNGDIDLEEKLWKTVNTEEITLKELKDKSNIYIRLTDEYNVTERFVTIAINNPSIKTYTEEELAKTTTRAEFEILGINATKNSISVQISGEQTDANLYNYYYKTINDEEYTLISTNTYYNEQAVITDITPGETYKIKVLVLDKTGKVSRSKNTATIIANEQAEIGEIYSENKTYIDNSTKIQTLNEEREEKITAGYTVTLPAGFKISNKDTENKQANGIVISDSNSNEYVWIPVNDVIYDGTTTIPTSANSTSTYKPMAVKQSAYSSYYESIIYTFNGVKSYRTTGNNGIGNSANKEPSLITGNASDGYSWKLPSIVQGTSYDMNSEYLNILGFDNAQDYGIYLANSYNNMIASVDGYNGFYVGRYETTKNGDTIGSKAGEEILNTANWYKLNNYTDSIMNSTNPYHTTSSVNSSMIWGSEWDAMLNYILTGADAGKVTTQTGRQKSSLSKSAQDETDIMNNIYDLGSNVFEWTQEANSYQYRVYRGGAYDPTTTKYASTLTNVVPTDSGPIYGTRMALYIQNKNDTTKPSIQIIEKTSTSNIITVTAKATDSESGIESFSYYIRTNEEDKWEQVKTQKESTYTYTGLTPVTEYYIKVEATDGAGNIGETEEKISTTDLGEIAKENIEVIITYGPDGEGVTQLKLNEEYTNSGYSIYYRKNDTEGDFEKGDLITGLSNGEKIYAKVSDGKNSSSDYFEYTVKGLEEYAYIGENGKKYETKEEAKNAGTKTSLSSNIIYTDANGEQATIPAGFKIGITNTVNTINNGLVIEDELGNQFVWVPVENVIYDETTALADKAASTSTYKPMARYQAGYSKETANQFFEGMLYNFASTYATGSYVRSTTHTLGTTSYREPSLITNGPDYTWDIDIAEGNSYDTLENYYKYMGYGQAGGVNAFNTYTDYGAYMNNEYSKMVQSTKENGGFYIGRFETSVSGTEGNVQAVAQSQISKTPVKSSNWYKDYYLQDSNLNSNNPYYENKSVTTSMIWGSQWDATLNWLLSKEETKDFVNEIRGNHTGSATLTGSYADDLANNIFDLSSNMHEWTQIGYSSSSRVLRGGRSDAIGTTYGNYTAGSYQYGALTAANYGTRMSMYINNTEDTTKPIIGDINLEKGTNYIKIELDAKDEETRISKYIYKLYDNSGLEKPLKEITTYGAKYLFKELTENSTYYITVVVENGIGEESELKVLGPIITDALNVQEGDIVLKKVYGKNGNGSAYFEMNEDLSSEGYYMQYQIGETYNEDGEWTKINEKTQTITELSEGETIWVTVFDGVNQTKYMKSVLIEYLEEYSDVYEETEYYTDTDGKMAPIPAGFKVGTTSIVNNISNGLVTEDEQGNQYVWIPVENVIYDEEKELPSATNNSTYKPMVRYQKASDEETTSKYYEGIQYTYSGTISYATRTTNALGTSNYREPSLVTGSTANYSWIYNAGSTYDAATENYSILNPLGITSAKEMGEYMNEQYTEMVKSVAKYKGFYVGRYETSVDGTTIQSQQGKTPMASMNWYNMYLREDSNYEENPYYESTSVKSCMIWGSQYDAMLNYILTGSDAEKVTAVTGNHTGTRATTGEYGVDIMNNIIDLSSNVVEWTQEATLANNRASRGGNSSISSTNSASYRYYPTPTGSSTATGSRLVLYIK